MLHIPIKYFDKKYGCKLTRLTQTPKGNWIDLYAAQDMTLKRFEFALLPLGVAMELPKGHEAFTAPRGSTFKNWGVLQTNSWGIVDNPYRGDDDEWFIPIIAMRKTTIKRGDKMFQFRIIKSMGKVSFTIKAKLDGKNRGGHGSTGKR